MKFPFLVMAVFMVANMKSFWIKTLIHFVTSRLQNKSSLDEAKRNPGNKPKAGQA